MTSGLSLVGSIVVAWLILLAVARWWRGQVRWTAAVVLLLLAAVMGPCASFVIVGQYQDHQRHAEEAKLRAVLDGLQRQRASLSLVISVLAQQHVAPLAECQGPNDALYYPACKTWPDAVHIYVGGSSHVYNFFGSCEPYVVLNISADNTLIASLVKSNCSFV